ncbi:MAG: hypothetical protein E7653_06975 [Ruminococcaceae bacterium]|nr:hypothetical protein [Oscillospiraceae bacterium]
MLLFQRKKKSKTSVTNGNAHGVMSELCKNGLLEYVVDEYISFCHSSASGLSDEAQKQRAKQKNRFANLAGLCRYVGTGLSDLAALCKDFPDEYDKLLAVFEDEALNSEVSPTLLSAYLKKRIDYTLDKEPTDSAKEVRYCFEHDIFADGE